MDDFKEKFCRLCLTAIKNDGFEVIEGIRKDILNVVLNLNLDEEFKNVMCKVCSTKLHAAFDFKSTCLYTEDIIVPYANCDKQAVIDLKEVYLKEKGNDCPIFMLKDGEVCRLCMQLVATEFTSFQNVEVDVIRAYIPEMKFLTKDPVICKPCLVSLVAHGKFVKDCLNVDEKIKNMTYNSQLGTPLSYGNLKIEEVEIKCEENSEGSIQPPYHPEVLSKTWETEWKTKCNPIDIIKLEKIKLFKCSLYDYEATHKTVSEVYMSVHKDSSNIQPFKSDDPQNDLKNHTIQQVNAEKSLVFDKRILADISPSKIEWHECEFCLFGTKHKSSIQRHLLMHHEGTTKSKWYKCELCGYKTKTEHHLDQHMLGHRNNSEIQWHKCNSCDYKSKLKATLQRHMLTHKSASDIEWYECHSCGYRSKMKTTLKRHLLRHKDNLEVQLHECSLCFYGAKSKHHLVRHMLTHKSPSEIEWHKCNSCDYRSKTKSGVKRHMLTHTPPTGVQWHECNSCNYRSKTKGILKRHMLKHRDPSEIQWHECNFCDYKVKLKHHLDRHMSVHKSPLKTQWYQCRACDYKVKFIASLKSHMLAHHDSLKIK